MINICKKIFLPVLAMCLFASQAVAHNISLSDSPHSLELKPSLVGAPAYLLAKSYWLGGADIGLDFKEEDDDTRCRAQAYTKEPCTDNESIISYCGSSNQYHKCGCDKSVYIYDTFTCGSGAHPDMSPEYTCGSDSSIKSDRCICDAEDELWLDGQCVFYCSKDEHCAENEICITSTGQCEFKDCDKYGCESGQICHNHNCETPNCVNGGTTCQQGETCDPNTKQCVEDPNSCPAGYQESACNDKQVSNGNNHTTSSGKICYACRDKTCDDLNCDKVTQTCNSAALICVDKEGCKPEASATPCAEDQKPLGSYVADNGTTCYQCQDMSCQEQLEAAGYGLNGAFGSNGTTVITKDITLSNFTNNKKYITLKGLSFSKCTYGAKPTVTLTQSSPSMSGVGMDNLKIKATGSMVLNGEATVKDTEFQVTYLDISSSANAWTRITLEGDIKLTGKLTVYSNGKLTVMNNFSASEGIWINKGTINLAYDAKLTTSKNIELAQSATLATEFKGSSTKGRVEANNIYSDGYIDFYKKNVYVTYETIINHSNDVNFCRGGGGRPGDCLLSLSDAIISTKNLILNKGAKFEPSSSSVTVRNQFTIYTVGTDFTATKSTITAKEAFIACDASDVNKKYYSAVARLKDNSTWKFNYGDVLHMGRGESVICFSNGSKLTSARWTRQSSLVNEFDGARVEGADNYKDIGYEDDGDGSSKLNYKNRGTCSSVGI